jgi:hypothetical protein
MSSKSSAVAFALGLLAPVCLAQAPTPDPPPQPCTTSPQATPCSAAPGNKGPSIDRFPFPGEPPSQSPSQANTPTAPDAPKSITPSPSGSSAPPDAPAQSPDKRFPFPGEDAPAAPQPAASGASSSSSSDPTAFPSDDTNTPDPSAAKDKAAAPEGRRLLKRVNPVGTKLQSPDEREAEDLSVARFYTQTGDLQGAYMRSQDAVKIMPDDPDAHCTLATAALRLNKRDEAISEFNACLKLDPAEKEAKNARKELAKLK